MSGRLVRILALVLAAGSGVVLGSSLWSPADASTVDNTYTAITPCVAADSRASQGATGGFAGAYTVGQIRNLQITGTIPAAQGTGGPTTCNVPVGADAVLVNLVAVNAQQEGNLRSYAAGGAPPNGGVVNFAQLTGQKLNTSNAVAVPLSVGGAIAAQANCAVAICMSTPSTPVTDVRAVVLGYFSDDLATRVAALEAKLQDVTRIANGVGGQDTLQFSGMNIQIVDGTDETGCEDLDGTASGTFEACNGQGNLVVGYAENDFNPKARTGSHNIVVGVANGWTSFGGAVVGLDNQSNNEYATAMGGLSNNASGPWTSITGGQDNDAPGFVASVVGGNLNSASGQHATVTGGFSNQASGLDSSVSGGQLNVAAGPSSAVTGGYGNVADGVSSTVNGGASNLADDTGCANFYAASTVSGGTHNIASGCGSTVSGGSQRTVTGPDDWRAGNLFETT